MKMWHLGGQHQPLNILHSVRSLHELLMPFSKIKNICRSFSSMRTKSKCSATLKLCFLSLAEVAEQFTY